MGELGNFDGVSGLVALFGALAILGIAAVVRPLTGVRRGVGMPVLFVVPLLISSTPSFAVSLEVQKVAEGVYALVGEMDQRSPENLGNNANFGVIVTTEGVVLVDAGGTYRGAEQIHEAVQGITDKPVVLVINTGGQDQRWLGNGYFKQQGARIIAAKAAVEDQRTRADSQLGSLERLVGEAGLRGTKPVYADEIFEGKRELTVGGVELVLHNPGPAHTPGDTYVWLPQKQVMFSGDIVYVERMLTVGSVSKSRGWIQAFEEMAAHKPKSMVPGHGHVTTVEKARADTHDYLAMLRAGVQDLIDNGMGLESVSKIDQSRFSYLKFYEDLKGRNAHQVYREMEWE